MRNQSAIEFVAFFAAEKSGARLMLANFDRERIGFAEADVGGIANDEVEEV